MVNLRYWLPGMVISINQNAVLDYEMDFTDWLSGETLSSVTVNAVNCNAAGQPAAGTAIAVFRVSNVQQGAEVSVTVVSSSGESDTFSVKFEPK